jgi:hypothetical protein
LILIQKHSKIVSICLINMLVTALTVSACGKSEQKQSPQQMSAQQQQQSEKEPQKLKDIEAKIEEMVKSLDGPSINLKEQKEKESSSSQSSQSSSSQEKTQSQSGQQSQGQSSNQQGQGQGSQQNQSAQKSQQSQQPQQAQPEEPWKTIGQIIANLHYQWNDYLPDAVKKGASLKITENFSNALNNLTVTAQSKDNAKALKAANNLYQYVPDLYSLYRTKMSSEIKKMAYFVRNIVIDASTDDWTQANTDSASLDASWSIAKNSLGKEQLNDMSKLDFSISELKKVAKAKDKQLTDIKGRVAMTNIEAIEKSYEKESSSQGQ